MDKYIFFIIIAVIAGAVGQILLKTGVNDLSGKLPEINSFKSGFLTAFIFLKSWKILLALFMYGSCAFLWLFILTRFELSYAFPLMAANYIAVLILSRLILGESMSFSKIAGTVLITLGIFLVAKGK